jgi:hypothetical protein
MIKSSKMFLKAFLKEERGKKKMGTKLVLH